ncbi:right-handed parallel beta-helix repeat-containing protein [Leeuwenhoekiella parthenopeia]|uniref:Right-handed parallel beta-helix repeat-containing protein n=1 Tax=Leeuwenhoekiella parthenopeia TaxID=2890320 RepID=A0ABS8GPU8_9FLAO|nr:right-handed parallel beta-helix repeat-containing protein [Leeuwenhoekiella parthenopeia]MCC4211995.1 right-handed parallel beta-helix repeat-containing protein [Leeuwenhoekiella parthenopeia]
MIKIFSSFRIKILLSHLDLYVLIAVVFSCTSTFGQKTLNLEEFGIQDEKDVTPIVVKALEKCQEEGYTKIVFPQGTYHFYPTFAPERYCEITNNDNGLKRTAFPLINFNDFEIDANGSDFIFHGKMIPFIIEESSTLKISNLSIDWEVPFALEGLVVARDSTSHTFDIKVDSPYLVQYGHLYLSLEREDSPYEKTYGKRFATMEHYNLEVGQNIFWDPKTMAPLYNTRLYNMPEKGINAVELDKGLVRISTNINTLPPLGSVMVSKGEYLQNRTSPAFRVFKSKELIFKDVNVHHAGAMGLIAERSQDITLDGFNVVLREGSGRMITTTADATHFCNTKGTITIKNCIFENMLDDATNIHGTYVRVNKIIDERTLAVETFHPHQNGYLFAEKGDLVRITDQHSLQPKTEAILLTKVERVNEKIAYLTFEEPISDKVNVYDGVDNTTWHASALIENNIVRNNRARGFLISSSGRVEVRNNRIASQMAGMRISGDLKLWNESGPIDGLIIEKNTFINNLYGGNKQAVILIDPEIEQSEFIPNQFYHRNIIIKNNEFYSFDSPILKAISIDGLIFKSNKIIQSDYYKPIFPDEPNLTIIHCKNVDLKDNTYISLTGEQKDLTVYKNQNTIK